MSNPIPTQSHVDYGDFANIWFIKMLEECGIRNAEEGL